MWLCRCIHTSKGNDNNYWAGDDVAARQAVIDNTQDIDIVMPLYNLIEYSDNYSKTSGSLWQYYKDDPNDNTGDPESFKSKIKII